jgi:hypothetical protein
MAVQHDLCPERRMAAHLDRDMSPLRVQDLKMVVMDLRPGLLRYDMADLAGTSHLHIPPQSR